MWKTDINNWMTLFFLQITITGSDSPHNHISSHLAPLSSLTLLTHAETSVSLITASVWTGTVFLLSSHVFSTEKYFKKPHNTTKP